MRSANSILSLQSVGNGDDKSSDRREVDPEALKNTPHSSDMNAAGEADSTSGTELTEPPKNKGLAS